ncbi:SDR family NAD(P)-dependent oxidoreductase [Blastococcus sp. Marseille-P5729]|uniref:SDR family NAD(P)-dependent oxidoreductase n=1 Tax=Blastococcus sp. Marseille-P5729 TaxID=2086582 RepID=UPI000D0E800F|nr:SDR family oxidoreductase [Blastococcus sp. Marseille-P5729]
MNHQTPDLTGKVAIVTGGSRGLGRAMSLAFADAGADVVVASRKLDSCEEVAEQVRQRGRRALAVSAHMGRWDEAQSLADRAYDEFGRVDVLVNNAGKSPLYETLSDIDEGYMDAVLGLNFKVPFRLSVVVGERMKADGGGSIINISSVNSYRPESYSLPYSAAKAALNVMSQGLAEALGPEVRVNVIAPGGFETDIATNWADGIRERLRASTSLRRTAQPEEIVGPALFLASDMSSYVTGAVLRSDGGIIA